MHCNLFISMSLNNTCWLAWYYSVLYRPAVWPGNPVWCRALHLLTTYAMLSTYTWMLCEGVFLVIISTITFINEEFWLLVLLALGWLGPAAFIIPYTVYRYQG